MAHQNAAFISLAITRTAHVLLLVMFTLGQSVLPVLASEPAQKLDASQMPSYGAAKPPNPIGAVSAQERSAMVTAQSSQFTLPVEADDVQLRAVRLFEEPLVPMGGSPAAGENSALAKALTLYASSSDKEDISSLQAFLKQYPHSRWSASVALNAGLLRREQGYFTEAIDLLKLSWDDSKNATLKEQQLVAQRAVSELLFVEATFGRLSEMKSGLADMGDRQILGSARERVDAVLDAVHIMEKAPQDAFLCGPQAVATLIRLSTGRPADNDSPVRQAKSTREGTNLLYVKQLADRSGLKLQVARRTTHSAELLVPCVAHFRLGHFSVLSKTANGKYFLEDPTLDRVGDIWISRKAINAETDGYFLVRAGSLPDGWEAVSDSEAEKVYGRGGAETRNEDKSHAMPMIKLSAGGVPAKSLRITRTPSNTPSPKPDPNPADNSNDDSCDSSSWAHNFEAQDFNGNWTDRPPMAVPSAFQMQAELNVSDTPLSYRLPVGLAMNFSVNYTQNEVDQPSSWTFSNLGPNWSTNFVAWVKIDASSNAVAHLRNGGVERYPYSGNPSVPYSQNLYSQATLDNPSAGVYRRLLPDGSIEVFSVSDGSGNYLLSSVISSTGQATTLQYDVNHRIQSVIDTNGNTSTFTHVSNTPGNSGFYLISGISDPFGRSCAFSYDATNTFLLSIQDQVGIVSTFAYNTGTGFITSMVTPYGTHSFETYTITAGYNFPGRGLKVTYPDGTMAVLENTLDLEIQTRYWDREAMSRYPNDPTNRIFSHCRSTRFFNEGVTTNESAVINYTKNPLESQVFMNYPGSSWPNFFGTLNHPTDTTQSNKQNLRHRFSISGTITPGDILYIKVISNVLPGGQEIIPYTVASGDTAASILQQFATLLNNDVELNKRGYYAQMFGNYLIAFSGDTYPTVAQSYTSVGATETFDYKFDGNLYSDNVNVVLGGTVTPGETISLFPAYTDNHYPVLQYVAQAGDTLESIAKKLAYDITTNTFSQQYKWSAVPRDKKIWVHCGWGGGTIYGNSTGTITVTTQSVTDQTQNLYEWNPLGYATKLTDPVGRVISKTYASNNIDLQEVRETRDGNNFLLGKWTYNSQHLPLTYLDSSGRQTSYTYNVFGQLTSVTDPLSHLSTYQYTSNATATVGGTISAGDQVNLTVTDPALSGGSRTVSYTASAGQTPAQVAAGLTTNINADTQLQALGCTGTASGAVITLKCTSVNATTYSRTVTGGVTLTLSAVAYGFLTKVTGPLQQADVTTFSWNPNGTLASSTNSRGYTLAFQYDALDRLTKTTYPDGTTEETGYQDLDPIFFTDRLGRVTQQSFDNMQQLAFSIDPLGRKTQYTWCSCGALKVLTDPAGHATTWNFDLQGRIAEKVYADGTKTSYLWEPNRSVVDVKRDALAQETQYYRDWDGTLASIQYANAVNATSAVVNVYDTHYMRMVRAQNGWGQYDYTYNNCITDPLAPPITGGGRLSGITNSVIPNSAITFQYDAEGRTTNRSINGAANSITWTYDAMNRVTQESNALGAFNFTYMNDVSPNSKGDTRLSNIAYPNGQNTKFSWFDTNRDERLRQISNQTSTSQVLSQFDYSFDPAGQITRWLQQQKTSHQGLALDYDDAGQLTGAVGSQGAGTLAPPHGNQNYYAYDPAANRTAAQVSQVQKIALSGTKTTGDIITLTVSDSGLTGGSQAVTYTTVAADTLTTIATKLAATITANSNLKNLGIDAVSSGTTITLRSKSPNLTTYTASVSGPATEKLTFGINNAVQNITVGGTAHTGDVLQVIVRDPALTGGQTTVSYTVPASPTLNSIASGLAAAINAGTGLSALAVTAAANNTVITVTSTSQNVTSYSGSVSGAGATVTLSLGQAINGSLTALVTGTKTTGDIVSVTIFDAGLSGGSKTVNYTVLAADTLTTITTGLTTAINNDTALQVIGVRASSSGTKLTLTSVSTNATTYLPSTKNSAGTALGTEKFLWGLPANGTTTAQISGTVASADVFTLTVFDAGLTGGSVAKTVTAKTTPNAVATGLATAINGDANLTAIGVTAVASTPTTSVSVTNITSTSNNATTYTFSRTGSSTIALSKSVGVSQASFNNINELTGISAGGPTRFQGTTDRPVLTTMTVAGGAVNMRTSQNFQATPPLTSGSNSVAVSATAGGGSGTTTNNYKLEVTGSGSQTLTYDANGNMTSDGTNSYVWDCENRLIQITYPGINNKSEFTYDPIGRNVAIVETTGGSPATQQFVWFASQRCEERDGSGNLTKRFFDDKGQMNGSTKYFYATDHLGSIREMTDNSGAVQSRYADDPYGRATKLLASTDSDFGFAGMFVHARSGSNLTLYRPYSSDLGRWLTKDPLGGANAYAYCLNSPVAYVDPLGLRAYTESIGLCPPCSPPCDGTPVPLLCRFRFSEEYDPRSNKFYWSSSVYFVAPGRRPGSPSIYSWNPNGDGTCSWLGPT